MVNVKNLVISSALLDLATIVRHVRINSEISERKRVYFGVDALNVALKAYHETLLLAMKEPKSNRLAQTLIFVYVKGVRILNANNKNAYEQTRDIVAHSRGILAYVDETRTDREIDYTLVNDLLDDLTDWEADGGWQKLGEYADSINVRICKGLANSFASHVLNNKYILAYATWLDLEQHVSNFATISYNFNKLRKFRGARGAISRKVKKLPKVFISERVDNPPPDETKFKEPTTTEDVDMKPTYKNKRRRTKLNNEVIWYCPLTPMVHPAPWTQWTAMSGFKLHKEMTPPQPAKIEVVEPMQTNKVKKQHHYDVRIADQLEYHDDFEWNKIHIANIKAQRGE